MNVHELTSLDWDDLRHFLALAQAGTLLGAARRLGVEHATVGRRVAALERRLGRKLVDRRGRRILLTVDGEKVAELVASIALQTAKIEQLGRSDAEALSGHIRISAPPAFSSLRLAHPIAALRQAHPGIHITLVGEKRFASLDRREADIAIRLTRPDAGDYAISKIGEIAFGLYAAPAYLAAVDPAGWTFIGYDDGMKDAPQQLRLVELAQGRPIALKSSMLEFQVAAARAGAGIAMLPDVVLETNETLCPVGDHPALVREIWLVVHSDIKAVPVIRVVVEALRQAIAPSQAT
ncbi:LysR family transcriptional regulator [Oryzifoliimicrobium ureilyticus]|uniref:LysR family transcriptional regulator n=1 Tax=Oryzifoliimicrobium ureilyticus TaxID=3113724 RepID=UPI0030764C9B